ncbi:conserved oligomeric Golgi complex subunit 8 isoform X2 [Rhinatrema bivittatum]|uniref:conserved oligomeric Golgi complex subunit 8 isoform X2 n=1 Tax=Rhinatrema bivittatum TaxID=194408 RepID=UPI00112E1B01|nr:conserved oligomeric Golgi complex subunit 8 isoform X2 [Rhinatrema bivittatum]
MTLKCCRCSSQHVLEVYDVHFRLLPLSMAAVDVEDESILASIFRDSFPESWRERPDFAAYLLELSSSGLSKLQREPDRLAEERAQILQQTRDLAFSNYKTFIRTAECTEDIYRRFGQVQASLARLLDKLPGFQESCRSFVQQAEEIACSRRKNSLTLNRHTEILEVLEIPQLMDTCVRNGYYEEALELATYVRRLEKKHSGIAVIQSIVGEVRQSAQLMLEQLVQQLRTGLQLPACLRVLGYLRRMDIFTEVELRVKFLQARDAWLRSIQNSIAEDDPYFHIIKTIETCRVHLFDIITEYRALFSDEDPLLVPCGEQTLSEAAIFHGWVLQKVTHFLQVLECDLQKGVGSRLDSLLGQCMYFGLSFSRVGADFRGQLAPIFQRVAMVTFQRAVQEAVDKFQEEMNSYTLILAPAVLGSSTISPVPVPSSQPGTLQPPMALLDFPPLACFLNSILTAFNDLRLCCPVALAQDVAVSLEEAISQVTKIILAFHQAEEAAFSSKEQELFVQFCTAFLEDLLPYLNRCLQLLFPPSQIAQILGVPATQLQQYGNLGYMDVTVVQEALVSLLPQKETLFLPESSISGEPAAATQESLLSLSTTDPELQEEPVELKCEEKREQQCLADKGVPEKYTEPAETLE